jgi:hypothetical protein
MVMQQSNLALDSYVSFIAIRDRLTSFYIEPWVVENGGMGGQNLIGYDPRFDAA